MKSFQPLAHQATKSSRAKFEQCEFGAFTHTTYLCLLPHHAPAKLLHLIPSFKNIFPGMHILRMDLFGHFAWCMIIVFIMRCNWQFSFQELFRRRILVKNSFQFRFCGKKRMSKQRSAALIVNVAYPSGSFAE